MNISSKKRKVVEKDGILQLTYDEGHRWYKRKEEPHTHWRPSVTTITSHITPEGLLNFYLKVGKEVAQKRMIEAGLKGTEFHAIKEKMFKKEPYEVEKNSLVDQMLNSMAYLEVEAKIQCHASEIMVLSDRYGFGGSIDGMFSVKELHPYNLFIGDYKTGYVDEFKCGLQLGAYWGAIKEMLDKDFSLVVFNVKKEESVVVELKEPSKRFVQFMAAFECFKGMYQETLEQMNWHWLDKEGVKL